MYFAVAGMMDLFEYLHYGLSLVLVLIGAKMLASHYYTVPTHIALATVAGVIAISIVASVVWPRKSKTP
jgi:tellurite resistance protein TerC